MSNEVRLYGFWRSLAAFRVRAALELKNIAYREETIDLMSGEQFSEAFDRLTPEHTLPVLVHEGRTFTQSLAILEYLEERFPDPPLLPTDPAARAKIRAFSLVTIADSHPMSVPRTRKYLIDHFGADDAAVNAWAHHWLDRGLAVMERYLAERQYATSYCLSDDPSLADIALASHMTGAGYYGLPTAAYPLAEAVFAACIALPAFRDAAPETIRKRAAGAA